MWCAVQLLTCNCSFFITFSYTYEKAFCITRRYITITVFPCNEWFFVGLSELKKS